MIVEKLMEKNGLVKITKRIVASLFAFIALVSIFSVTRESLVPYSSDVMRAQWRMTGDEPGYLLTATAIAHGDGENVREVHAERLYTNYWRKVIIGDSQFTWEDYHSRMQVKSLFDRSKMWEGKQFLHGGPLLPLAASPFVLSSSRPRWSFLLAQGLVAALFAALLVFALNPKKISSAAISAFAVVALLGSIPTAYYTAQIFPETLIGVALASSLFLSNSTRTTVRCLGHICLFASLWGSSRVGGAVTAVALLYVFRAVKRKTWSEIAVICGCFAAYFGYHLWLWGNFVAPNTDVNSPILVSLMPKGLLRNYFANDVGIFVFAPVAFAGVVSSFILLKRWREEQMALPIVLLWAGIAVSVAMFSTYRAGTCPAGRYQVAQIYVLLCPTLLALTKYYGENDVKKRLVPLVITLGIVSLMISLPVLIKPNSWHEKYHPLFKYSQIQGYYNFLPNIDGSWRLKTVILLVLLSIPYFFSDLWSLFTKRKSVRHE